MPRIRILGKVIGEIDREEINRKISMSSCSKPDYNQESQFCAGS